MPSIDERARHDLFEAVQDKLGPRHADTLMSLLPPVGWADVVTKTDLDTQIAGVRSDIGLLRSDLDTRVGLVRTDLDTQVAALRSEIGVLRTDLDTQTALVRADVGALEARMDHRFEQVDQRFDGFEQRLRGALHKSQADHLRVMIFAFVGSLVTMTSVCLSAVALVT